MKIPEELLPVVEWWERNSKQAIAVLAVLAVAGVGYWAWDAHRERARQADGEALRAALVAWNACQADPNGEGAEASFAALRDAAATSGAKASALGKLLLANAYFRRGGTEEHDYENALAIYDELAASGDTGVYADIPALGRAHCLEALGRFDEALAAFDADVAEKPGSAGALDAACGAARSLAQAGKKDEAVARLEKLLAEKDTDPSDEQALRFTLDLVKRWRPAGA